jgi:hypothetical protein
MPRSASGLTRTASRVADGLGSRIGEVTLPGYDLLTECASTRAAWGRVEDVSTPTDPIADHRNAGR